MSGENPEPVVFPPESLNRRPLCHIPNPDRLVLAGRKDQFVFRVKHCHGDIVEMTSTAIHLPRFGLGHPPQLDLTVVSGRDDQWESRVESGPVDSTIMPLENVFDDCVGIAKQVGLTLLRPSHLFFEGHGCLMCLVLFAETRDIPYSYRQIHGS